MPKKETREPIEDASDLNALLDWKNPYVVRLAQAGTVDPDVIAQAQANLQNQQVQDALQEGLETPITPEIQALADSLGNSSIEIYTWVHNNIRFIPSHGSIQGAAQTLATGQGNAMDTASLLVALLRASNIPARFAYGTVVVPAEQAMNWVGGAETPEAAQAIMGMGGMPITGVIKGGKIAEFKLEHVWVEAYVDYFPSRGVVERAGDSWVPMDASFKQHDFAAGMDLQNNVPFDAESLALDLEAQMTVNEDEGWVQGSPQALLEAQLASFQTELENYVAEQNSEATVGEVLGLQSIKILPARPLADGLPYKRIITSQRFNHAPANLQHKFHYSLSTQSLGYAEDELFTFEQPTAALAGKAISLSFVPATEDDEAIIASYLPQPDENGDINPADLPQSLPGYLINLNAEFTVGGEVIHTAPAGTMGTELYETMGYWNPHEGDRHSINYPIAGSYRAIGLDLQGASPEHAAK